MKKNKKEQEKELETEVEVSEEEKEKNERLLKQLDDSIKVVNDKINEQIASATAQGKDVPESVWADGVPENIKETDKITQEELQGRAIDYVMVNLVIPNGFKIEPGFPRPQIPNIICKRDGQIYAFTVLASVFPRYQALVDKIRLEIVNKSAENSIIPLLVPIAYRSFDEERARAGLLLKGDLLVAACPGILKLDNSQHQELVYDPEHRFDPTDPNAVSAPHEAKPAI